MNAVDMWEQMVAWVTEDRLICPDYSEVFVTGSLTSGTLKSVFLEVVDCWSVTDDCETDPAKIT